jgi:hypothetical protein
MGIAPGIASGIESDRIAYEALLERSRQRSIFAESWWLDAVTGSPDDWRANLLRDDDGSVLAAWPLPTRTTSHGLVGHGAPYTPWLGPLLPEREPEIERISDDVDLLESLAGLVEPYAHVEAACLPELDYWTPLAWHGYTQTSRTTWRIGAGRSAEDARTELRASTRKALSRAERQGVTVRGGTVDELLAAWASTFERQGAPVPNEDVLERVARLSVERGRGQVLAATGADGELAAAGLFVWDDRFTWSLAHGWIPGPNAAGAPTVLVFNALVAALERGTGFDFEGSMLKPVEKFVRGFGGEPVAYSVVRRSSPAWERSVARKRRVKRLLRR